MTGHLARTRQELATVKAFMDRYPGAAPTLALGYGPNLTFNGFNSALPPPAAQAAQDLLKAAITPVNTATRPVQEAIKSTAEMLASIISGLFR